MRKNHKQKQKQKKPHRRPLASYTHEHTNYLSSDTTPAPSSTTLSSSYASFKGSVELPPVHIQHHLAQIYLRDVHPIFPLLSRSAILARSPIPQSLVLALCSYCSCLSPSLGLGMEGANVSSAVGDATRIAADMWYEQARSMVVNEKVRKRSDLETIQTVLFLVLRDQGRGKESQAWLLMG